VLLELLEPDAPVALLQGGRGGRGNTLQRADAAERRATRAGRPGVERPREARAQILADVGLVGLPNAGKSTLLAKISARVRRSPRIRSRRSSRASAWVERRWRQITVADLPGLIEGASEGRGLGHQFLKHVERTRVLVHLVDASTGDAESMAAAWRSVRDELAAYGERVCAKPEVLVLSKIDARDGAVPAAEFARLTGQEPVLLSSLEGAGVDELMRRVFEVAGIDVATG